MQPSSTSFATTATTALADQQVTVANKSNEDAEEYTEEDFNFEVAAEEDERGGDNNIVETNAGESAIVQPLKPHIVPASLHVPCAVDSL